MISGIFVATSFAFSQGNLDATFYVINNICSDHCSGSINLTVSGGTPPYSYMWSNGQSVEDLSNLCNNNYSVTITDFVGDTIQRITSVTSPIDLTCTISNDTIICSGDTVTLRVYEYSGGSCPYSFYWNNVPSYSIIHVSPDSTTTYSFRFSDAMGHHSDTSYVTVFVEHYPSTAHANINGNAIISNSYCGNQWYFDTDSIPDVKNKGLTSALISGATEQQYTPTETGYYFDVITDNNSNELVSNVIYFTYNASEIIKKNNTVQIYPNPAKGYLNIDLSNASEKNYIIGICNLYGQTIAEYDLNNDGVKKIDIGNLKSGLYLIKVKTDKGEINKKVIILE